MSLVMPVALQAAVPAPCATMNHREVPASVIALPTRGAFVQKARHMNGPAGGFCMLLGQIRSIDPNADPIRFELNLPDTWNGKALQYGGGAFNGYLHESDGLRATVLGDRREPAPLARGYATFGSDSGHHHHYLLLPDIVNTLSARFALNDEQRKNFASESLKKTHDTAIALLLARYGSSPTRMYFIGGSTGGREAMMAVDRWPGDYDGVLAAYAAWNQIESDLQFIRISQAMYARGKDGQSGWLPLSKQKLLRDAILNACDAQDGLKDGIVSNPVACHFDAATLRCPDGRDRKGCLSDGQQRTLAAFVTPQVSTFKVSNGIDTEPGFNTLRGADLVGNMGLFAHPFHPPLPLLNSFFYLVGDGVLHFFLTKDKHFDALTFDTRTGGILATPPRDPHPQSSPVSGVWVPGILQQSVEDDAGLADLTPFATTGGTEHRGGKLLLMHGTADSTIPTDASVFLYQRIVDAMGQDQADKFLRLYLIPGYGHGRGTFNAGFDTIGTLDRWVEQGIAPTWFVAHDQNKNSTRTRPVCPWPAWPGYTGGDPSTASSFTCEVP